MLLAILQSQHGADYIFLYLPYKEYHSRHRERHLPYKEMSKTKLFHVSKMAARFCAVNQQLYYYLPQLLWGDG